MILKNKRNALAFGLLANLFLFLIKLLVAVFCRSTLLASDAAHSFSDVFASLLALTGEWLSHKKANGRFQYGFLKLADVTSALISVLLLAASFSLVVNAKEEGVPSILAFCVCLLSIVVKETAFRVSLAAASRSSSELLKADAYHHRTDSLSSLAVIIGWLCAALGVPYASKIAVFAVAVLIFLTAAKIFYASILSLADCSADANTVEAIKSFVLSFDYVISTEVRTRRTGGYCFAEIYVKLNERELSAALDRANELKNAAERTFERIASVLVVLN